MVLSDWQIADRAKKGMIDPFVDHPVRNSKGLPVISYGLSSYGYDVRLDTRFKVFTAVSPSGPITIDPKNFNPKCYVEHEGLSCTIPPHSFVLGSTVETFDIPRDLLVICIGKSTYARIGLICNVTPLEPEWRGTVTLEISNTTPLPAIVYANEGISQFVFHTAAGICKTSYADRNGKYQDQKGVTLAKV